MRCSFSFTSLQACMHTVLFDLCTSRTKEGSIITSALRAKTKKKQHAVDKSRSDGNK